MAALGIPRCDGGAVVTDIGLGNPDAEDPLLLLPLVTNGVLSSVLGTAGRIGLLLRGLLLLGNTTMGCS